MPLDVLIEDARIVDGTGAPWFRGAVGIEDGRIATVARGTDHGLAADVTLDADGLVACPGFVDVHSHADIEVFDDPLLEPKLTQGVTTEVVGQDGLSMAPMVGDADQDAWEHYLGGLNGRLDGDWRWSSTAEYLDAVDDRGIAPNVAMLVGHGTVRYCVLGMTDEAPTDAELDGMADLVAESLDQGAIGFSTGLDYMPHKHATTGELRRLVEPLAANGRPFVAHVRYSAGLWNALDEFVDVGADAGVPVHLSHFKLPGTAAGLPDRALHLARAARERGIDFTADLYPYSPGSTLLLSRLPAWVQSGHPEDMKARLRDPERRADITAEVDGDRVDWDRMRLADVGTPENEAYLGSSVADVAASRGQEPVDAVCDLLLEGDLAVTVVIGDPSPPVGGEDVRSVMASDLVAVGSDGIFGRHPHPRVYGTYPRVLGTYVREERLFTLEEAVRKMTSLPARAMGLQRKGLLRPGMDADVVVFDPETVADRATFEHPTRTATGIPHVLVDGEFVVREGDPTGATPGGAIRM